jgi:putative ABC transport system permease protein
MRDLFTEIWLSIRRNKLRTCLTGFAVAWGIFMLIVLLGAGNGLRSTNEANTQGLDFNSIEVWPGETSKPYDGLEKGRVIEFTDGDIRLTKSETFSDVVDDVAPRLQASGSVTLAYGTRHVSAGLDGVTSDLEKVESDREMVSGRFINRFDDEQQRKVIVIGSNTAKLLNEKDPYSLVGQEIKVNNYLCKVVGIYKVQRSSMGNTAYIPYSTLKSIYAKGEKMDYFSFSFHGLKTEKENEDFENKFISIFNRFHRAAPDDNSAIYLWNNYTTGLQVNKAMNITNIALWIVGLFTLLSGIVGVSNIMLISVKERTHEFGIRKAIGAKPWGITKLILSESVVITAAAGYVGMFLGMIACEIMTMKLGGQTKSVMGIEISTGADYSVGLDVALEATLVLIIAGCLAGLIPALKAARVRPIEALRAD